MGLVVCSLSDPCLEGGFRCLGKHGLGVGGRHDFVLVLGVDAFEEFAGVRFAGDDRGLAGLSLSKRVFAEIEPQLAFTAVFVHAVALEAVLG